MFMTEYQKGCKGNRGPKRDILGSMHRKTGVISFVARKTEMKSVHSHVLDVPACWEAPVYG